MTSIVYPLILFIFIFGAGVTWINETGLYSYHLPDSGIQTNSSEANAFNTAMTEGSKDSGLSVTEQVWLMGKCIFGGILAIFTLGPLLISFGVPTSMTVYLLSPLAIIIVFWLIEMWLGRPSE